MWTWLVKRLSLMAVTLFGIALVSFVIVTMAPGDPAALKARALAKGRSANISEQVVRKNREMFFLDRPLLLNLSPPTRESSARGTLAELISGRDKAIRDDAQSRLTGVHGTAALDVLLQALPGVVSDCHQGALRLAGRLARLDGDQAADELAALARDFPELAPPPQVGAAQAVEAWQGRAALLLGEVEAPARRLLEVLAAVVGEQAPELARAPLAEGAAPPTPEALGAAWTAWWGERAGDYTAARAEEVAQAWLERGQIPADEAPPGPELQALLRVGQLAAPALMSALRGASPGDERERRAAYGLAAVCHKAWDLTASPADKQAWSQEWEERLTQLQEAGLDEAGAQRQLGSVEAWVAAREREELARQRYRWADWWYRAEEYYVDFGPLRLAGRALTQTQFGRWTSRLLRLDFGESYKQSRPVLELIWERLPPTLILNLISTVLAYLLALPLGIYSATHPRTRVDRVTTVGLFLLYSVPSFWAGSMLILFFTGPPFLDWFPAHHFRSLDADRLDAAGRLLDVAKHIVLPVICLTYAELAYISRQMRSSMMEAIRQDYVRTARAKGLPQRVVVYKHALRNALIPILTLAGSLLPLMFAGSVIIESVFTIDGLGKLAFDAILDRDYPVIMANLVISAFLTLVGILLADIGYALVDPRIELR